MKCPVCPESVLAVSSREGVEIDYCPTCRGVWLDRGELDKIIERTDLDQPAPPRREERPAQRDDRPYQRDDRYYGKKRKESVFERFFDFD